MEGIPGARWQDDAQLHLTLRFIGEVDMPLAEDIALALSGVRASAPKLALSGVGRFDDRGRTSAIWAAVAPREQIAALHRKVDRAITSCGLPPERRAYLPHITIARFSRSAAPGIAVDQWVARHATLNSVPFTPTRLELFESHLGRDGASYEAVAAWPLTPGGHMSDA